MAAMCRVTAKAIWQAMTCRPGRTLRTGSEWIRVMYSPNHARSHFLPASFSHRNYNSSSSLSSASQSDVGSIHSQDPIPAPTAAHMSCDVLIVGGGHAGCEAAVAAARLGAHTLLVTNRIDAIGVMSCNPSMGGIGKGTLIREIDALGGVMAETADKACIQFRLLNTSKGSAVHSPRMQLDRDLYRQNMQNSILCNTSNLQVLEGSVDDLILSADEFASSNSNPSPSSPVNSSPRHIRGVLLADGRELQAKAVVLTTGTFLRGKLLQGRTVTAGGRRDESSSKASSSSDDSSVDGGAVEPPATKLAQTLQKLNFPLGRMRTGTPPRLDVNSIDLTVLEPQQSHAVRPFSFLNSESERDERSSSHNYKNPNPLIQCYRTQTTAQTRDIVLESVATGSVPSYESQPLKAPSSSASSSSASSASSAAKSLDDSNAPRYCPSLENKYRRFAHRDSHAIMLEPEGLSSNVLYPQGLEISSSPDFQLRIIRSLPGCENAKVLAYGYAVEYDYLDPKHMQPWLESKLIRGLFTAGQINGTTGYEEAAAQGIIAGFNAVKVGCQGKTKYQPWSANQDRSQKFTTPIVSSSSGNNSASPFILPRSSSFIGVLLDDLLRYGASEPYRMFTSRSEFRLSIRQDNADRRLTPLAVQAGLLPAADDRVIRLQRKTLRIQAGVEALKRFKLPKLVWSELIAMQQDAIAEHGDLNLFEMPNAREHLDHLTKLAQLSPEHCGMGAASGVSAASFFAGAPLCITVDQVCNLNTDLFDAIHPSIRRDVEIEVRYQHFIDRQQKEIERTRSSVEKHRHRLLPSFDEQQLATLFSLEDRDKMLLHQPRSIADALQIGLSPTAVARLMQQF